MAKEAKLALTKAVTVFISYLLAHVPTTGSRSVNYDQILEALQTTGFGQFQDEVHKRVQSTRSNRISDIQLMMGVLGTTVHKAWVRERDKQRAASAPPEADMDSGVEDEPEEDPVEPPSALPAIELHDRERAHLLSTGPLDSESAGPTPPTDDAETELESEIELVMEEEDTEATQLPPKHPDTPSDWPATQQAGPTQGATSPSLPSAPPTQ